MSNKKWAQKHDFKTFSIMLWHSSIHFLDDFMRNYCNMRRWTGSISYVSTFISFSMISLCSDTMANTLKKILVLAIIFPILTTLIWISSDLCVHSYPKVLKCSPINDSDKISATKIPLLPIPPLEITDSKFLSTFKNFPLVKSVFLYD